MGNILGTCSHPGGAQDKGTAFGLHLNHILGVVALFGHFVGQCGLAVAELFGGG